MEAVVILFHQSLIIGRLESGQKLIGQEGGGYNFFPNAFNIQHTSKALSLRVFKIIINFKYHHHYLA